jgi:dynein heavy chain
LMLFALIVSALADQLAALTLSSCQMARKQAIADNAANLQRQMEQASTLIQGLADERVRWEEDHANFANVRRRIVGDCAVCSAFAVYCGPFNHTFRQALLEDVFVSECSRRGVPVTSDVDVSLFLCDASRIGDWSLHGLPLDPLSVQNGVLVTGAASYPLLVDPQGQALSWLKSKEKPNLPLFATTTMQHKDFRDRVEFCMQEGKVRTASHCLLLLLLSLLWSCRCCGGRVDGSVGGGAGGAGAGWRGW